jgi:hypothetical protein
MPTLTLQPGPADGLDTRIFALNPTKNYGVGVDFSIGEYKAAAGDIRRSLIKFDLSTIPAGAAIVSATLTLTLKVAGGDYASNNRAARVYRTKRAWVEGTRYDAVDSPPTGATWNRYDLTNNWSTAGGFHADDCEQVSIGSHTMLTTDAAGSTHDFVLAGATKADLDLGNGWMLKMDTEVDDLYEFYSSDHATAAWRPKLVIDWLPAAAGLLLQLQNHGVLNGGAL